MEHAIIRKVPWEGLEKATNGFSEENYIGTFQSGKVYRGKLDSRDVTVKIWEEPKIYPYFEQDNEDRLRAEVFLLQHEKLNSHPNLVKLLGYCCEGRNKLGVVYDLKPLDTVHNLILKDSFTWPQRIKVALGFARLLDFLHTGSHLYLPTLVRNIDAAHIMLNEWFLDISGPFEQGCWVLPSMALSLPKRSEGFFGWENGFVEGYYIAYESLDCITILDVWSKLEGMQEYNPILYDFGIICSGILPNWSDSKTVCLSGSYGYIDIWCQGIWNLQRDVFSFGVLLLCLMAKRIYTNDDRLNYAPYIFLWAEKEYNLKKSMVGVDKFKFSLVHESFKKDPSFYPGDGPKITGWHCYVRNVVPVEGH
ncbi:hypothetical protein RJ639_028755 [Escallonia herrerae]|uniref:Protein kinase domain-containing protein n=1 Tax=Escallonia herrerae TaxID=1293975 RepID=A0AA88RUZ3_9ASTE|nr:hypothetical protein RJ639_024832 [Escallonia herrerae]KAK3040470.1 hypothetical protein RJ639_028755 [Escallonia herrerae]